MVSSQGRLPLGERNDKRATQSRFRLGRTFLSVAVGQECPAYCIAFHAGPLQSQGRASPLAMDRGPSGASVPSGFALEAHRAQKNTHLVVEVGSFSGRPQISPDQCPLGCSRPSIPHPKSLIPVADLNRSRDESDTQGLFRATTPEPRLPHRSVDCYITVARFGVMATIHRNSRLLPQSPRSSRYPLSAR